MENQPLSSEINVSKIIFTRYLYVKDEVILALVTSIIDKHDKSLFWAYELYYSGFETELFYLLWKIYFDFYYTLNHSFYAYFIKKCGEWKKMGKSQERDKIVGSIVSNLLIRPHNLDIFLLRQVTSLFEVDIGSNIGSNIDSSKIYKWLSEKNYLYISEYVLNRCSDTQLVDLLNLVKVYFLERIGEKKLVEYKIKHITVGVARKFTILAYIMLQFSMLEKLKSGKNLYVIVEDEEVKKFETIYSDYDSSFYPYKILPLVYIYSIDEDNYMSLFTLNRDSLDLRAAYLKEWEYHASYSPVWRDRIEKYKGTINHVNKKIEFPDDDYFEEFYDAFNYETDEQKSETINKSIQEIIEKRTWMQFYEQHKKNGLFNPDSEFLEDFGRVIY